MIYFITGNPDKFNEAKQILPILRHKNVDLPEIQETDPKIIIKDKLKYALKHSVGQFIVEDTSLYLEAWNGLPGPLIKWFMKTIGNDGIVRFSDLLGNPKATAKTIIGYAKSPSEIYYYEGILNGTIVAPRGNYGFGWDAIFVPEGLDKTLAEMTMDEKNNISTRKKAFEEFKKTFYDMPVII